MPLLQGDRVSGPWFASLSARSVEALNEKVRVRLDYPDQGELAGYRDAVEALDKLTEMAHSARREAANSHPQAEQ